MNMSALKKKNKTKTFTLFDQYATSKNSLRNWVMYPWRKIDCVWGAGNADDKYFMGNKGDIFRQC